MHRSTHAIDFSMVRSSVPRGNTKRCQRWTMIGRRSRETFVAIGWSLNECGRNTRRWLDAKVLTCGRLETLDWWSGRSEGGARRRKGGRSGEEMQPSVYSTADQIDSLVAIIRFCMGSIDGGLESQRGDNDTSFIGTARTSRVLLRWDYPRCTKTSGLGGHVKGYQQEMLASLSDLQGRPYL